MSQRLAISVEGQSEYEFCREVLQPHLHNYNVYAEAKIVLTKRNISGPNEKGGSISIDRITNEIRPLLYSFDYVTTLYDFYGFKGKKAGETADNICEKISDTFENSPKLIPYLQVYEFDTLLFSSPDKVGRLFNSTQITARLSEIVNSCGGVENINDNPITAPSKRLGIIFKEELNERYHKTFHGPLSLLEIGLPSIREACPRFNGWLSRLEALSN